MGSVQPKSVLRGHDSEVQALAFPPISDQDDILISGDSKGEIRIWNLSDLRPLNISRLHPVDAGITNLRLLSGVTLEKQRILVTQGRNGMTNIWSCDPQNRWAISEKPIKSLIKESYSFCKFSVLEHTVGLSDAAADAYTQCHTCTSTSTTATLPPALIAIAGDDAKSSEIWCIACNQRVTLFPADASPTGQPLGLCMALQLFYSPLHASLVLAAGYEDGSIVLWSLSSSPSSHTMLAQKKVHEEPIMALYIHLDGTTGVVGSAEDKLVAFKIQYEEGTTSIQDTHEISVRKEGVGDVCIREDGKLLVAGGWDGRVRIYKYSTGKMLAVLKYHTESISAVEFSPSTWELVTGSRDGNIAIWDVYSKNEGTT